MKYFIFIAATLAFTLGMPITWDVGNGRGRVARKHKDDTGHIALNFPWESPSDVDSVSPCPFLNTARNHGLLPRSGRNITSDQILTLLIDVVGLDKSLAHILTDKAMDVGYLNAEGLKVIDLSALQRHGFIEHDASLSRIDSVMGNSTIFNPDIYSSIQKFSIKRDGRDYLSLKGLGKFRKFRQYECREQHPITFDFGLQSQIAAAGEAALIYLLFKDDAGDIRMDWLDVFFTQERLPFNLGWNFGTISLTQLLSVSSRIMFYQNT